MYTPCEIDPSVAPDAIIFLDAAESFTVNARLCSLGYDQSLRVYDGQGNEVARTDAKCSRTTDLNGLQLQAGQRYTLVIDGQPGEPYGSWRAARPVN